MSWLDTQTQTGLGLKMGEDQQEGMPFFSPVDLYLTNQSNKRLLLYLQPRQSIWLQQKLEKKPCGLVNFLAALRYRLPGQPVSLKADNRGAILFTANPEFHRRTQPIEVRRHWIREKVE